MLVTRYIKIKGTYVRMCSLFRGITENPVSRLRSISDEGITAGETYARRRDLIANFIPHGL